MRGCVSSVPCHQRAGANKGAAVKENARIETPLQGSPNEGKRGIRREVRRPCRRKLEVLSQVRK